MPENMYQVFLPLKFMIGKIAVILTLTTQNKLFNYYFKCVYFS